MGKSLEKHLGVALIILQFASLTPHRQKLTRAEKICFFNAATTRFDTLEIDRGTILMVFNYNLEGIRPMEPILRLPF
jgi:hypothetical protein